MRPTRTGGLALMLVSLMAGCGAPGGALPSPSPEVRPIFSPTPSLQAWTPTPQASATPRRRPTPTARALPTATPSPMPPELLPLWAADTVSPNWLIFQPMKPRDLELEPVFWFTDGEWWRGPYPMPESFQGTSLLDLKERPFLRQRDKNSWLGCLHPEYCRPLPLADRVVPRQPLRTTECQGSALRPELHCELPAGLSWSSVEIPNPWRGKNPCEGLVYRGECKLRARIEAFPGDQALLVEIRWDADLDPDVVDQIENPEHRLLILEPDLHRTSTLIQWKSVGWSVSHEFSPDGRFLLVNVVGLLSGFHELLIFRWPEGDGVARWAGAGVWLWPEGEAPKP